MWKHDPSHRLGSATEITHDCVVAPATPETSDRWNEEIAHRGSSLTNDRNARIRCPTVREPQASFLAAQTSHCITSALAEFGWKVVVPTSEECRTPVAPHSIEGRGQPVLRSGLHGVSIAPTS
jgi:hypothetical protein